MKRLIYILLMVCGFSAAAEDFESVRKLADRSSNVKIADGVFIEGIVISDRTSLNMADNSNISWNEVDLGENFRSLYVQSEDGKYGFRVLSGTLYNTAPKFSKVRIDLTGARLIKESDPERYTISGVAPGAVTVIEEKVVVAPKKLLISQLKDEDVYTYVSVQDLEFASKQGAYTNVFEPCVQESWLNEFRGATGRTDSWPSMLKDGNGDVIYMLVNTKCTWRRKGDWMPQGKGEVRGVLVHSAMRRHGGVGRYSIRPAGPSEIAIAKDPASSYETIVEWNWNRNYECALNLEKGCVEWIINDVLDADRILADVGSGFLATTIGAKMTVAPEYDSRNAQDGCEGKYGYGYGEGSREYGAVCFISEPSSWYAFEGEGAVPSGALLVETSTSGISGRTVTLDFTWTAGHERKIAYAWGFPTQWQVSWSTDGQTYNAVDGVIALRPMFWGDQEIKGIGKRNLAYDAAMGFTEHSVKLPAQVLGQEKLFIRIAPCSDVVAVIPADPEASIDGGRITPDAANPFHLNVGKISLQVIK